MSQRVKKLPSKGKSEDGGNSLSSKGKRKKSKGVGGTKGSNGGGVVLSGDDSTLIPQSHPDSASKTPWTPRYLSDLKSSNIYNRNAVEAPAESECLQLFRKDLISAMKLPDSEPLGAEDYWSLSDPWRQEWERGVQVPVSPDSLPIPRVMCLANAHAPERTHDFKLPKNKFVRVTHDDFYSSDIHQLTSAPARSQQVCAYDMDDIDLAWLNRVNNQRNAIGTSKISELSFEQAMEELERQSWANMQTLLKTEEFLGIEYDENVICDVCRAPDSEEGNEMVFCDRCNICVHQACYGILSIPPGPWLCKPCALGLRPPCQLCPNQGGALKATRGGSTWAHVACALWIPEVSIGCVEKMEPITKISSIPASRWGLICILCKEKSGACIQCSVKACKTAYHVTCAFRHGLEMKAIVEDEHSEDGVKLRSYCQKHSMVKKVPYSTSSHPDCTDNEDNSHSIRKPKKDMTVEERNLIRAQKLQQIESEFFKYANLNETAITLDMDLDVVDLIFHFWILKRKSNRDRPLLPPKTSETERLSKQQQQDMERMKMFVQLRQDLERVRNLCYMVSRREKLSRSYFRLREQTFHKQIALLSSADIQKNLSIIELNALRQANHGSNVYDTMYSSGDRCKKEEDFDKIVQLISGLEADSSQLKKDKVGESGRSYRGNENPYRRNYLNGSDSRRSRSISSISSESTASDNEVDLRWKKIGRTPLRISPTSPDGDSDTNSINSSKLKKTVSKTNETKTGKFIYTDSEDDENRSDLNSSLAVRTKAAVKAFSPVISTPSVSAGRVRGKKTNNESKISVKLTTELIVPQRQAAKKATESLHNTNANISLKEKKEDKETKGIGKENVVLDQQPILKPDVKVSETAHLISDSHHSTSHVKSRTESSKNNKDSDRKGSSEKASDFPSYVPQRQAARKAAETIKIGSTKSVTSGFDIDADLGTDAASIRKNLKVKSDLKGSSVPLNKIKMDPKTKSKMEILFDLSDSDTTETKELLKETDGLLHSKKKGRLGAHDAESTQATGKPFRDRGPRPTESESQSKRGGVASSSHSTSTGRGAQKHIGKNALATNKSSSATVPKTKIGISRSGTESNEKSFSKLKQQQHEQEQHKQKKLLSSKKSIQGDSTITPTSSASINSITTTVKSDYDRSNQQRTKQSNRSRTCSTSSSSTSRSRSSSSSSSTSSSSSGSSSSNSDSSSSSSCSSKVNGSEKAVIPASKSQSNAKAKQRTLKSESRIRNYSSNMSDSIRKPDSTDSSASGSVSSTSSSSSSDSTSSSSDSEPESRNKADSAETNTIRDGSEASLQRQKGSFLDSSPRTTAKIKPTQSPASRKKLPLSDRDDRSSSPKFKSDSCGRSGESNINQSATHEINQGDELPWRASTRFEHPDGMCRNSAECPESKSSISSKKPKTTNSANSKSTEDSRPRDYERIEVAQCTIGERAFNTTKHREALEHPGEGNCSGSLFKQANSLEGPFPSTEPPVKKHKTSSSSHDTINLKSNFEYESELLDIAQTVSCGPNEDHIFDKECDTNEATIPSTLKYSLSTEVITKADTNEDSARETMNLVEKLRMQYAFKTCPTGQDTGEETFTNKSTEQNQAGPPQPPSTPQSKNNKNHSNDVSIESTQPELDHRLSDVEESCQALELGNKLQPLPSPPNASSSNSRQSKWKPLTPAKELGVDDPPPLCTQMDSSAALAKCKNQIILTDGNTPHGAQKDSKEVPPNSSSYPPDNPAMPVQQDHNLQSTFFYNIPPPPFSTTTFPFPPFYNNFFQREFLPSYLFPPAYSSASPPDIPTSPSTSQRPAETSLSASTFPRCRTDQNDSKLVISSSAVRKIDESNNKNVSPKQPLDFKNRIQDSNSLCEPVAPKSCIKEQNLSSELGVMERQSEAPSGISDSEYQSVPCRKEISTVSDLTSSNISIKSDSYSHQNQNRMKTGGSLLKKDTSLLVHEDKSLKTKDGISNSGVSNLEIPVTSTSTSSLPIEVGSPAWLSNAGVNPSNDRNQRQRPARQAAINATKATAEQLNEMHPSISANLTGTSSVSESALTQTSNSSPTRQRGGPRSRGGNGQRGARSRGGGVTKRGGPLGVFEPKLVSGLSAQNVAGTVYDFDDFNDELSDSERNSSVASSKSHPPSRKVEPLSMAVSNCGKSPKCNSNSKIVTGLSRLRKSREMSGENIIVESENEPSRSSTEATFVNLREKTSSSPMRKRPSEFESAICTTSCTAQTVPPMRLTIPRSCSLSMTVDSNTSRSGSIARATPSHPEVSENRRDTSFIVKRDDAVNNQQNLNQVNMTQHSSTSQLSGVGAASLASSGSTVVTEQQQSRFSAIPIAAPSVKAMQDLEALESAIESALAAKSSVNISNHENAEASLPLLPSAIPTPANTVSTNETRAIVDSSRHALKFKIKGPFLDANYSSGNNSNMQMNVCNSVSTPSNESSNLRRMRKKELIRQYVSQDVTTPSQPAHLNAFLHFPYSSALAYANEEYLLAGSNDLNEVIGSTNSGTLFPSSSSSSSLSVNQYGKGMIGTMNAFSGGIKSNHISIPKAVASLGSLGPLNEDSIEDSPLVGGSEPREGRRRRRGGNGNPPLSRELRNLQLSTAAVDVITIESDKTSVDTFLTGRRKERRRGRPPAVNRQSASGPSTTVSISTKMRTDSPSTIIQTTVEQKETKNSQDFVSHPPPKLKIRFRGKVGAGEMLTVCDSGQTEAHTNASFSYSEGITDSSQYISQVIKKEEETEARKIRFRPPKKRISDTGCDSFMVEHGSSILRAESNNPPTLEELRRQSMKFREEVMADFSKSEKRKGVPLAANEDVSIGKNKPDVEAASPPSGLDSKPEFKNKRHKTKTRKDRSKSKDRDGNNRKRPLVASTDLMSIAGGGSDSSEGGMCKTGGDGHFVDGSNGEDGINNISGHGDHGNGSNSGIGYKRKRSPSGDSDSLEHTSHLTDQNIDQYRRLNGVKIISKDGAVNCSAPPKLIIRFGKKPMSSTVSGDSSSFQLQHSESNLGGKTESQGCENVSPPPPLEKPSASESLPNAGVTSLRLMPLKLKLARCSQGYVTKGKSEQVTPPPSPTPPPTASSKESCQVR